MYRVIIKNVFLELQHLARCGFLHWKAKAVIEYFKKKL